MPKDPERQPFYCPFPGCKRKFASLWRLKVHYRAPPNERGSGKERGHGVELPICPACGEELEPGKHHNKCKAGRTTNPPSKRVSKTGAAAARGAKPARAGAGTGKKKAKRAERPAPAAAAVESTSGNSYADAAGFMPHVLAHATHDGVAVGMPQRMFAAPMPGYPAYEFACMPSLHVAHGDGAAGSLDSPSASGRGGHPQLMCSADLSARGAAEVLFTIAKSENDGAGDEDASPRCAHGAPLFAVVPSDRDPGGHAAPILYAGGAAAGRPMPAALLPRGGPASMRGGAAAGDSGDAHTSEALEEQTVDGVPVDALGAGGLPVMMPWGAAGGDGAAAAVHMAMTPRGLVPIMHGGQQFLMPVQTMKGPDGEELTVAMRGLPQGAGGEAVGLVLPPEAAGAPLMLSEDGTSLVVAGGAPPDVGGEFPGLPVDGVPCSFAVGQPPCGLAQPGISEEDFLNAMRMASNPEVSATS